MLDASVIAYMVSGLFLNLAYFDLFYHLVAIVIILKVVVARPALERAAAGIGAGLRIADARR
jgi:hypothetical protein